MTPRRLTLEEARAIAEPILQRHGVTVDAANLSLLSDGLAMTCDRLDLWTLSAVVDTEHHNARLKRIEALRTVRDLYKADVEETRHYESANMHLPANACAMTDTILRLDKDDRLERLYDCVVKLLATEEEVAARFPEPGMPQNRPPTAKNVGAQCVYEVLRENGVEPWPACGIIAEMVRAVGIEGSHDKVQRSLYDKMHRLEVR